MKSEGYNAKTQTRTSNAFLASSEQAFPCHSRRILPCVAYVGEIESQSLRCFVLAAHPRAQPFAIDAEHAADVLKREHAIGAIVEEPFSHLD